MHDEATPPRFLAAADTSLAEGTALATDPTPADGTPLDRVTGLTGPAGWSALVERSESRCRTLGDRCSVAVIGVEGLDRINATAGPDAGDALLRRVAAVVAEAAGTRRGAGAARVGGDEVGLLLHGIADAEARAIARDLAHRLVLDGIPVSVGVAEREPADGVSGAHGRAARSRQVDVDVAAGPARRAAPSEPDVDTVVTRLLDGLRRHLGMDAAFVGEWHDGQRTFRHVSAAPPLRRQLLGQSQPLAETVCGALVVEPALGVLPDASSHPATAAIPVVRTHGIGAHLGVPVILADGSLYGTLCCAAFQADEDVTVRDLVALRVVAEAIADHLGADREVRTRTAHVTRALDEVMVSGGPAIVFQPVVDVVDGSWVGFEALARFPADLGRGPLAWFSAAGALGRQVELELAAIDVAVRRATTLPHGWLAVNASPDTLTDPTLPGILERSDRPVVIELTEHVDLTDVDAVLAAMAALRARGHRVAVDDAGIGHSGLARVVALRPDVIKVDRYLVHGIAEDQVRGAAVASLVQLASAIGASLVGEGVERPEDLDALRSLGVPWAQGFLLARPAPAPAAAVPATVV